MSTTKRRLYISLSPELDLAIERLSKATRVPQATLVTQLLDGVVPQLHALASAAEQARQHPTEAMQTLLGVATAAQQDAAEVGHELRSHLGRRQIQRRMRAKPKVEAGS